MSDDVNEAGGEGKTGSESKSAEQKVDIVSRNQQAREAILAKHQAANPPVEGQAPAEGGKSDAEKSVDEKSEIGAQQSESAESEGKENKSSVEKSQNKNEKPKGDLEKALQEEREKRKKANLEVREARLKHEAEIAALQKQLDELKRTKQDESAGEEASDPEKVALRRELEKERAKREADDKLRAETDQQKKIEAYNEKVNKTHSELKDAGYRGFKFCQPQIREAILKRYNEGEFVDQDLNDPAIWKKVFVEDVYVSVKDEFPASNEKELLEKKLEAKKKAAAISNPGPAPKHDTEEKKELTLEEMNKAYLKQRQEASRKVGA